MSNTTGSPSAAPSVGWNLATVYEAIAAAVPDRPCQIQGERVISWAEFDRRADSLAADLLAAGLGHRSKVAWVETIGRAPNGKVDYKRLKAIAVGQLGAR